MSKGLYINKVQVYGRLGKDPEIKQTQGGTDIASFSIATTYERKDANGNKIEETEWHNCVFFGKRVPVIEQYVHKGDKFMVEGRLKTQTWEDKETGKKMYRTEIVVEDFSFGDNPKRDGYNNQESSHAPQASVEDDINIEDIPF